MTPKPFIPRPLQQNRLESPLLLNAGDRLLVMTYGQYHSVETRLLVLQNLVPVIRELLENIKVRYPQDQQPDGTYKWKCPYHAELAAILDTYNTLYSDPNTP